MMSFSLIVIGLVVAVFGAAVIVAGAPEWVLGLGLGASLIESGTIGFVGGLVVFGIGLLLNAVHDLGRRLDALKPARKSAPDERATAERVPEIEPSLVPQQFPLPPMQPAARPAHPSANHASAGEKDLHPRAWPPSTGAAARVQSEPPPRMREPASERPPRVQSEPPPRMREPATERDTRDQPDLLPRRREPAPERDARVQTEPSPRMREPASEPAVEEIPAPKPEPAPKPRAPVPVAVTDAAPAGPVVRSGIIGGMAYTLYADGSIEADMALGIMRFASIEDLRAHVARTGADADAEFRGPATKS